MSLPISLKGAQLGRFIEVEIRNFSTGMKYTIGNDFEIEFEYHKTIDENQQDSTGRIQIYGLTQQTIKSLQSEGGEVRLRCGYENTEIETLFVAYILRLYPEKRNNTTITTIECSANLMNFYVSGGSANKNRGKRSLGRLLLDYSKPLGASAVKFNLENVPQARRDIVEQYVSTAGFNASFYGTADSVLTSLCVNFNLTYTKEISDDGTVFVFSISNVGLSKILKETEEGYDKIVADPEYDKYRKDFFKMYKSSKDEYSTAFVLNLTTGLKEVKTEYKIATAYEDQVLGANEEQTLQSKQQQETRIQKQKAQDAKDAKKKAEGKKVKERVRKRSTIKVNRRYARVTALLNPKVKPQGHIIVQSEIDEYSDLYRVREATYRGNNKRSDFIMDLYCEDNTDNKPLSEIEKINTDNQQEITGELGEQGVVNE